MRLTQASETPWGRFVIPLFVNGVECERFRDTGSDILIVREDLVEDRGRYTGEVMKVVDAFGRAKELQIAAISIRSLAFGTDKAFQVTAAVDKQ